MNKGNPPIGSTCLVLMDGEYKVMTYDIFHGRGRNGTPTWIDEHGDDSSSYGLEEFPITHWELLPDKDKEKLRVCR